MSTQIYPVDKYLFKINNKCSCVFIVNFEEEFAHTQQTRTCAKATIEILEEGVKYVQI